VLAALRNTAPTTLRLLGFRVVEGPDRFGERCQKAIQALWTNLVHSRMHARLFAGLRIGQLASVTSLG
jgi:hypothetical protein